MILLELGNLVVLTWALTSFAFRDLFPFSCSPKPQQSFGPGSCIIHTNLLYKCSILSALGLLWLGKEDKAKAKST